MRHPLLITFIAALVAVPSFAGPGAGTQPSRSARETTSRVKSRVKVRHDWAARYQSSRYGPEVTERFNRTVRIGASGAFELSNISGNVTVTGGAGDEVRIDAMKRARARDQSNAKALLDELRIELTELPNRLEVRTMYPQNRRNFSGSVDYTITMPAGASATLKTVSGDVRVTNVKGELRAETVSGNVVTSGASRLSFVKSVSGDVEATDVSSDAAASLSTVSGNVTARGVKARSIELGSVSGDIIVTNATCDRAIVKTTSGNIEYAGPLARSGRYEMSAHSGTVRLAVSATTGFELEATTFNGDVRVDYPLTLRAGMESGPGRRLNRSIRGSFGDAGAIVNLKSFSGDIVVTK